MTIDPSSYCLELYIASRTAPSGFLSTVSLSNDVPLKYKDTDSPSEILGLTNALNVEINVTSWLKFSPLIFAKYVFAVCVTNGVVVIVP